LDATAQACGVPDVVAMSIPGHVEAFVSIAVIALQAKTNRLSHRSSSIPGCYQFEPEVEFRFCSGGRRRSDTNCPFFPKQEPLARIDYVCILALGIGASEKRRE
jgi:hypothetical protein